MNQPSNNPPGNWQGSPPLELIKTGGKGGAHGCRSKPDGVRSLREEAHDLQGLLHMIVVCTEKMFLTPSLPSSARALGEQICTAAIDGGKILNILRRESNSRDTPARRLPLGEEITRMAGFVKAALPQHVSFEVHVEPGEHTVNASSIACKRAVMNLVLNAKDAVEDGGKIELQVTRCSNGDPVASALGPCVRLSVADNGSGIPPEVEPHLFRPGFTSKAGGDRRGLGLSQVRSFAEGAGGTAVCRSTQGVGSRFDLYLPLLKR